ncbi:ankyrin repeat domain-containing protein [Planctomycetota bacterium]
MEAPPLEVASQEGHTEIVKLLKEYSAGIIPESVNKQLATDETVSDEIVVPVLERKIKDDIVHNGTSSRLVISGIKTENASPSSVTISDSGGIWSLNMEQPSDSIFQSNMRSAIFGNESIHRFHGEVKFDNVKLPAFIGDGNNSNRLTFLLLKDTGYVYMRGKGRVVFPDGRTVELGNSALLKPTDLSVVAGANNGSAKQPDSHSNNLTPKSTENVDRRNSDGVTQLMVAAEKGHLSIVKELISRGANIHLKEDNHGMNALMLAASEGHLEIVESLVEVGAKLDEKDKTLGATSLMVASKYGYVPIVKLLLSKGAKVNLKSHKGYTALAFASLDGHLFVVKELVQTGADVNSKDNNSVTALMAAAFKGHFEIVEILVTSGADINAKSANGMTASSGAKMGGHENIVRYLDKIGTKK